MKKDDIKYLSIFILLITIILFLVIYNYSVNKKKYDIDRKINYVFQKYSYDSVYSSSKVLFLNAIKLAKNDFLYEQNESKHDVLYAINGNNKYKKILDHQFISSTLSSNEYQKYLDNNKIVVKDNNYYIENNNYKYNKKYIGSTIDIENYDDKYVYFNSLNYYCDNYEYNGILYNEPNCEYTTTLTEFTIVLENDYLKIYDLNEIKEILK